MRKILLFSLFFILFARCESYLENPKKVSDEEKAVLFATKNELLANGLDTLTLFCRLPKESGFQDVTFTTTNGLFLFSGVKVIKEFADSISGEYRFARVILKSDTLPSTAYLTAENLRFRERISIKIIK